MVIESGPAAHRASLFLLLALGGCAASDSCFGRHFDADIWAGALVTQTERPGQLLPALGLLEATAVLAYFDHDLQAESTEERAITEGSTDNGDMTAVGLGVLGTGVATAQLIGGDAGASFEVLLESVVVTDGITELLKHSLQRERPATGSPDSFPSGHTSFAFAMATFCARSLADAGNEWYWDLGALAYLPAAYVGINRSEANKHWPSDIAAGAFLGFFLTNVVYDAHFGSEARNGIFGRPDVRGWNLEPALQDDGVGLQIVLRF